MWTPCPVIGRKARYAARAKGAFFQAGGVDVSIASFPYIA